MTLSLLLSLLPACAESPDATDPVSGTDAVEVIDPAQFDPSGSELPMLDLEARGDFADAVFAGEVVRIDYRQSSPDAQGLSLPFTFVTWRVDRAWKGTARGSTVVARFVGGVTPSGQASVVSEVPIFQEGDRDVVLLDQNGLAGCPLVGCATGRFRIIDGRVYDNEGATITADADGALRVAGWRNLAEINVVTVGNVVMDRRVDDFGAGEGDDGMTEVDFAALLDLRLASFAGASESVRSVHPDAPFLVRIFERKYRR